jgi:hypothetical protein
MIEDDSILLVQRLREQAVILCTPGGVALLKPC